MTFNEPPIFCHWCFFSETAVPSWWRLCCEGVIWSFQHGRSSRTSWHWHWQVDTSLSTLVGIALLYGTSGWRCYICSMRFWLDRHRISRRRDFLLPNIEGLTLFIFSSPSTSIKHIQEFRGRLIFKVISFEVTVIWEMDQASFSLKIYFDLFLGSPGKPPPHARFCQPLVQKRIVQRKSKT